MNLHQIDFEETKRFSSLFLDYIQNQTKLREFYNHQPDINSFEKAIEERGFNHEKRKVLADVIQDQYLGFPTPEIVSERIDSLPDANTFTLTTGHQLNIFTGPLFFIYKIVAVINMSKALKQRFPKYNFVPVYWMASEDHDFEEINNFNLFGKKYTWESDQSGPVGRFSTETMAALLDELPEKPDFCADGYLKQKNLADATRYIVNHLFGKHGLVILDADDALLKKELTSIIKDDLFNNMPHEVTQKTTSELDALGYKTQIFPRPINFFYMEDGLRQRIEKVDGKFMVLNTDKSFTKEEIETLIDEHPERFSPNVVLRPVYQEVILPNLAYVGGPAEVVYWLQLKGVFDHFQVPYPILFPRLFGLIISKTITKKMDKLHISNHDIFEDFDALKEKLLYADSEPAHILDEQLNALEQVFTAIQQKAVEVDKSLEGFIASEHKKVEKGVINIQKRLKRAEEQKEEVKLNQLRGILEKLFPEGHPQEREDNFLNFFINNPKFIDELIEQLDPFSLKYNVITDDA